MSELLPIATSKFSILSRYNRIPVYKDTKINTTFVGLNLKDSTILGNTSDINYVVDSKFSYRPDLISYKFYQTPLLGWLICQANDIVNPYDTIDGIIPGKSIRIPSKNYIFAQVL